jgi:uridine kinase
MINEHLNQLLEGQEVLLPYYDFQASKRYDARTPMKIGPDEMILIDSLHGLYPAMTEGIDEELKFKLYVEPLLQMKGPDGRYIRWADLRLMRRMVRDASYRSYDPERTLGHWHYVRKSEMHNIIPFANTADCIVNTGLAYELPVMRTRLFDYFEEWVEKYRDDPLRQDAFERAGRVYRLLDAITPVDDESPIPPDSLLREFIGGSCYEY